MNNVSLSLKEQKILWTILNQAQHIGLEGAARHLRNLGELDLPLTKDWLEQTQDEYDVINTLKVKLCGDLE